MPDTLQITLAQANQSIGDINGTTEAMLAARKRVRASDLIVFPELHISESKRCQAPPGVKLTHPQLRLRPSLSDHPCIQERMISR